MQGPFKKNVHGSENVNVPTKTLTSDAHVAHGQFLHEKQTLNKVKSPIYRKGTRRTTISKTEGRNKEPR
jgi:hypothetical protein